jgi:hypothetical protein
VLGISSAFQEDNRFVRSQQSGFGERLRYAVESVLLARRPNGTRRVSISHIGALVGAALVSRAWQPRSTEGIGSAGANFGMTLGVSMGFDVAREFWPGK